MERKIRVGLLGLGEVGRGVLEYFMNEDISKLDDYSVDFIGVRNPRKERNIDYEEVNFSERKRQPNKPKIICGDDMINDYVNNVDIVVDAIGGDNDASREYMEEAMNRGKHVVTCNKDVVSRNLLGLTDLANSNEVNFRFGASLGGGIPIINNIKNYFARDKISKLVGIVNGTSNYILTQMHSGKSYQEALQEAKEKGYAEKDPSDDISGRDAASKLAIASSIIFNTEIKPKDISVEGIDNINRDDIYAVSQMISDDVGMKYAIKPLAVAEREEDNLRMHVHPAFISEEHPLFGTDQAVNALVIKGEYSGVYTIKGPGAGSRPTGFAAFSDIFEIGENIRKETFENYSHFNESYSIDNSIRSRGYIISTSPEHKIGAFAEKVGIISENNLDIWQIRNFPQHMARDGGLVPDIICTDFAREKKTKDAVEQLKDAQSNEGNPRYLRENIIQ